MAEALRVEQEVRAAQELERTRHETVEQETRAPKELQWAREEAAEQTKPEAILAAHRAGRKAKKRRQIEGAATSGSVVALVRRHDCPIPLGPDSRRSLPGYCHRATAAKGSPASLDEVMADDREETPELMHSRASLLPRI